MAWEFEKVYEATVPTSPNQMAFDGRYLWVSGTNTVYVYEFFGESSGHEPKFEELDELTIGKYNSKLVLVDTIAVPNGAYWIAFGTSNVLIADKAQATKFTLINNKTRKVGATVALPETMNSNMVAEGGRIWMVSKDANKSDDRQYLHGWNGVDWVKAAIPTRKQLARAIVCPGYNGSVYVTNFNNVAICKFNATTGAFQQSIRVNAFPQNMLVTANKDLYVSSFAGMLSKVDTNTSIVSHPHSTFDVAVGIAHQPGSNFIWFLNSTDEGARLGRLNTADNSVFFTAPKKDLMLEEDWELSTSKFTDKDFSRIIITQEFKYKQLVGAEWKTITVKPYMFLLGATKIMAVRLDRPIYRDLDISIEGRSMISTGAEDYMGEIG